MFVFEQGYAAHREYFASKGYLARHGCVLAHLALGDGRGMMLEAMKNYGPDSFVGRLSCIFQGSTDTTFFRYLLL